MSVYLMRALRRDAVRQSEMLRRTRQDRGPKPTVRLPWPWQLADLSMIEVAERSEINRAVLVNWQRRGLTVWQADRLAVSLGRHPAAWWPEWFDLALIEAA